MSWVAVDTFVTGELLTASDMNNMKARDEYLLAPATHVVKPGANTAGTNTTWAAVGASWAVSITTNGGPVTVGFAGHVFLGTGNTVYLDVYAVVDGDTDVYYAASTYGIASSWSVAVEEPISFVILFEDLPAGTHTFQLHWKGANANGHNLRGSSAGYIGTMWAKEG